jgi:hypothetical protein
VFLRSSRTPPYPSSTILISRDANPACRGCYARVPGRHEKNGRPVQADCEAIEGGSPRAGLGAWQVEVPLRSSPISTSGARCWLKKESVRIPSPCRLDASREQDAKVPGFIPVYDNRIVAHIRTAISKA